MHDVVPSGEEQSADLTSESPIRSNITLGRPSQTVDPDALFSPPAEPFRAGDDRHTVPTTSQRYAGQLANTGKGACSENSGRRRWATSLTLWHRSLLDDAVQRGVPTASPRSLT